MTEMNLTNIVIPCPLMGFAMRKAEKCLNCPEYMGMAQATVNGEAIESEKPEEALQVICGKPITRRMQRIIED